MFRATVQVHAEAPWERENGITGVSRYIDGNIEEEEGTFDRAAPDREVHAFMNDLVRPIGTFLYRCHMFETMIAWEDVVGGPPPIRVFGTIWRKAQTVEFSRAMTAPSSARTRIEPEFRLKQIHTWLDAPR